MPKPIYTGKYRITQSWWNLRSNGTHHKGLDVVGDTSKNLHTTCSGTVLNVAWDTYPDGGMGYYVKWQDSAGRVHYFAHCSQIYVKRGQVIGAGQVVAREGNTGHSFGSHCHYEIREYKRSGGYSTLNPAKFIGIPNKVGAYTYEEVEDLTKDETQALINKTLKGEGTSVPSSLAGEYEEAKALGITDGTRPGGYMTRAEGAVMALRAMKKGLE